MSQTGQVILVIRLQPPRDGVARDPQRVFFPEDDGIIENAAEQTLLARATAGCYAWRQLTGSARVLPSTDCWWRNPAGARRAAARRRKSACRSRLPRRSSDGPDDAAHRRWPWRLPGGLILNLMPCVFPVVSIKVLGFVQQAHGDRRQLRLHGLAFALGVSDVLLGGGRRAARLRSGGAALGWGYQLQSPLVVAVAGDICSSCSALNLSGLFELGHPAAGAGRRRGWPAWLPRLVPVGAAGHRGGHTLHRAVHGRCAGLCADAAGGVIHAGLHRAGARDGCAVCGA